MGLIQPPLSNLSAAEEPWPGGKRPVAEPPIETIL